MRKNILVVDSSLLSSRTIAMMYEVYGCDVSLASDVEAAVDVASVSPVDVVVMGPGFCRESGKLLRTALRAVLPGLPIGVMDENVESVPGALPGADFHIRPTHFFTDLCQHISAPPAVANFIGTTDDLSAQSAGSYLGGARLQRS